MQSNYLSLKSFSAFSLVLATVIFALDLSMPLGVAGGVPYVALVLLALLAPRRRYVIIAALVGTVLTVAGWLLSPPGGVSWVVTTNRFLAMFAIWVTAILGLNRRVFEERMSKAKMEAELLAAELETMVCTDALTGIANRRFFDRTMDDEWSRAKRSQHTVSLILLDVDFFKNFNDNYGHQAGDRCLKKVALALSRHARRPGDLAARYGGEEFALILPRIESAKAIQIAHNIQAYIESLQIPHEHSEAGSMVTVSLGVATLTLEHHMVKSTIIELADRALYQAKDNGRNTVVVADPNSDLN
ncbi:hypothetical protein MNBD_NITROSPINAE01-545 [hydrothermal vent metagenome]|uniref:GGDEF domain-containing protein n=1 Tax=hydrothermal vent metagenome TaxID=652676 RepID=A0A3B1CGQ1_9ZZZZ